MEDEEFSYKAYSEGSESVPVTGSSSAEDEELAYTGYSDEDEEGYTPPAVYGDFIIEEFSSEVNVPRIAQKTGISQEVISYVFAVLYLIVGVLCVSITEQVQGVIPYIVGGVMVLVGLIRFITAIIRKEYRTVKTNQTASSLIFVALGIMIIVERDWAITFISIVWGILGLMEAARAFNHAFSKIAASERCIYHIIKGIVEVVLAFMLLYEPDHHITLHIIVFGVQLIIDAVYMLPWVKRRFSLE